MGDLPSGWKPQGLQPQVKIYDWDDSLLYTYEHSQTKASPTKDFDLYGWSIAQGIGTNFGQCVLDIHDHDNLLTDLTSSRRPSKIKNEFKVEVYLGKDTSSVNKWFVGRIREGSVVRSQKQQTINVFATGFGTLMSDRYTRIAYSQAKDTSDPLALDSTDTTSKASELTKAILGNEENYLIRSEPVLPFSVTGIDDIDVKIANFDKRPATPIATAITELANMSGTEWGIDYSNLDVWMRYPGSKDSGFLITNDLAGNMAQNWTASKLGVLLQRSRSYTDSSIGYATPYIFGPGALYPIVDVDDSSSDASVDLSDYYHAIAFTPSKDNVWIFAPFLVRNGTPSEDLSVSIIGADINGDPDTGNIAQTRVIRKERLQDLSLSGEYVQIEFDRVNVAPNIKLFLYFHKYGDAVNPIDLDYQTGSGEYWTSSDGTTWNDPQVGGEGKLVGAAKMRVYSAKRIQVNYMNTTLNKEFANQLYPKELILPVQDFHKELVIDMFASLSQIRSRQGRFYDPIVIYPPESPIKLGESVRYIDKFNGLDITADIQSYKLGANAYDLDNNGAVTIELEIREPFAVA